jgi:hypothetical protein
VTDLYLSFIGFKIARTFGNVAGLLATLKLRPVQERQNTFGNVAKLLATFFLSNPHGLTPKTGQECQNSLSEGARRAPQVAATSLGTNSDPRSRGRQRRQHCLAAARPARRRRHDCRSRHKPTAEGAPGLRMTQTTENNGWGVTDLSTQKGPLSPLRAQVSTAYRTFTFPTKGRPAMVRRVQPPVLTPQPTKPPLDETDSAEGRQKR